MIDLSRPEIGFAAAKLLSDAGCRVNVPAQSCCGQPAYNNGNRAEAIEIAKSHISQFEEFDHVIAPSASCAGMIKYHYPQIFDAGSGWQERALTLGKKTFELTDYLYRQCEIRKIETEFNGRVAFHESCSARREMKVEGARKLLATIEGIDLIELKGNEECCGFGGLFSVKYDALSNAMVETKIRGIEQDRIDLLTGVDLGCLHNIGGKLKRNGLNIKTVHVAELLANSVL